MTSQHYNTQALTSFWETFKSSISQLQANYHKISYKADMHFAKETVEQ